MKLKVFSHLKKNSTKLKWPNKDLIKEQIKLNGYAIIENFINKSNLKKIRKKIDELYRKEIKTYGYNSLKKINDLGVLRSPYLESVTIANEIFSRKVLEINKIFFDDQFILHVNRGIINSRKFSHPAATWHREPPYQNFTTNEPVALTFVHLIDKNSLSNGGLKILKCSHKWERFPSEDFVNRNFEIPEIKEGSLLVFDSALFHCASENKMRTRRSLVTIFTTPLMKQQINISKIVDLKKKHDYLSKVNNINFILGLTTNSFYSDKEYRDSKLQAKSKIY